MARMVPAHQMHMYRYVCRMYACLYTYICIHKHICMDDYCAAAVVGAEVYHFGVGFWLSEYLGLLRKSDESHSMPEEACERVWVFQGSAPSKRTRRDSRKG